MNKEIKLLPENKISGAKNKEWKEKRQQTDKSDCLSLICRFTVVLFLF
jgi:hypothetical protein